MRIESPQIPYNFADLEPAMSRDTLVFHFLHHQRDCFDRMLSMVRGTELETLSLGELVCATERDPERRVLFHHAAEVWNHDLFWRSMRPRGGGAPHGLIDEHIGARFGSYQRFAREFKETAASLFGSGWLWLVWSGGELEIVPTRDADTPLLRGDTALLALDLWEHAYYLEHQNRRGAYVDTFLEELVNWDFVNRVLAGVVTGSETRAVRPHTVSEIDRGQLSAF
jgi:superoxide dismutase, Fe-Mn family